MKNLRVICWVWIVASTIVILFRAPVSVTRQDGKSRPQVTRIEWIGPFKEPFSERFTRGDVTKSSIDFSRLVIAILAANFLPAVLLWQHNEVVGWLERRKVELRKLLRTVAIFLTIGILLLVGLLIIYELFVRPVKIDDQTQTRAINPVKSPPAAAPKISPDDWEYYIDPTPTPVRRAIPIAPESRR